jgi:hypothetical protein
MTKSKTPSGDSDTVTDLTAKLEQARQTAVVAAAAVEAAEAAYQAGLLTEAPTALRRLAEGKTDAGIRVDQAAAIIVSLEAKLAAAIGSETEARRREQYDSASALAETARKQLFADYPAAAEKIRAVLRAIAAADIAVEAANQDLPEGAAPIAKPENSRALPNFPQEMISEERVELWSGAGDTRPIPPEFQHTAQTNGRDTTAQTGSGRIEVVKRTFDRTEYLPALFGRHSPALASAIELPGLSFGEGPYWTPASDPAAVLAQLDKPRRPPAVDGPRVPTVEHRLIRNP